MAPCAGQELENVSTWLGREESLVLGSCDLALTQVARLLSGVQISYPAVFSQGIRHESLWQKIRERRGGLLLF